MTREGLRTSASLSRVGIVLIAALLACGGLGDADTSDAELPSTEMGPFRALVATELKGTTAPFVLDDKSAQYNDPAAFEDGVLYVATQGALARTHASNGRTFDKALPVLSADAPWEGLFLSGPWPFRHGAEVWLFYAGKAGIGLARSTDGIHFTKGAAGPVLAGATSNTVKSPSVFALPDGRLRMLYTNGTAIDEAESTDGLAWRALGTVLAANADPAAFDGASVGDPCAVPRVTPAGRFQVRVLYTGTTTDKAHTTQIGFAARYGEDGPLERNPVAAYTAGKQPAYAPPFLYVTQADTVYGAVGGAVLAGTVLAAP